MRQTELLQHDWSKSISVTCSKIIYRRKQKSKILYRSTMRSSWPSQSELSFVFVTQQNVHGLLILATVILVLPRSWNVFFQKPAGPTTRKHFYFRKCLRRQYCQFLGS